MLTRKIYRRQAWTNQTRLNWMRSQPWRVEHRSSSCHEQTRLRNSGTRVFDRNIDGEAQRKHSSGTAVLLTCYSIKLRGSERTQTSLHLQIRSIRHHWTKNQRAFEGGACFSTSQGCIWWWGRWGWGCISENHHPEKTRQTGIKPRFI